MCVTTHLMWELSNKNFFIIDNIFPFIRTSSFSEKNQNTMEINTLSENRILPGINDLVEVLHTSELNEFIQEKCKTDVDKRTFLMFILMYFYSFLNLPENLKSKKNMKVILSEFIANHEYRSKCIELYTTFEESICHLQRQIEQIEQIDPTN